MDPSEDHRQRALFLCEEAGRIAQEMENLRATGVAEGQPSPVDGPLRLVSERLQTAADFLYVFVHPCEAPHPRLVVTIEEGSIPRCRKVVTRLFREWDGTRYVLEAGPPELEAVVSRIRCDLDKNSNKGSIEFHWESNLDPTQYMV